MYQVTFKPRAEKVFSKIDKFSQQRIVGELDKLAQDPFVKGNLKKISGTQRGFRLRVGRWRVLFSLYTTQKLIEVVDIFMEK